MQPIYWKRIIPILITYHFCSNQLTTLRFSNLAKVFRGMNAEETKLSSLLEALLLCSVLLCELADELFRLVRPCCCTILASTTSKLIPPAVLPLGLAKSPSSLKASRIRPSSILFFWYPDSILAQALPVITRSSGKSAG